MDKASPGRPRSVTILVFGVLIIAVFFGVRLAQAFGARAFLGTLALRVSPAYLMATGFVFFAAGLAAAWGLWRGAAWAPAFTRRLFIALAVYYWLDLALFAASETARGNWPFMGAATLIGLAWVFWVLARPGTKTYFQH